MSAPDFPPDLGPRLRTVRAQHKLWAHEVAAQLGVTREMVTQMETGVKLPARPVVMHFRHCFGRLGADYIMGKTDALPSLFSQRCARPCSECDGRHHAVLGSKTCKHCAAVIPEEQRI